MAKIDQVAALLAKASADGVTPEEAEALTLKAQQLMTSHGITEELLARATGERVKKIEIVERSIAFTGIFQTTLFEIGRAIALTNNCKTLIQVQKWIKPTRTVMYVIGFEDDVTHVEQLVELVLPQAHAAVGVYWKSNPDRDHYTKMESFKDRREFLSGFARGLRGKLLDARRRGEGTAATQEATRANVSSVDAQASVELVVRSKNERVDDWTDKKYGNTLRTSRVGANRSGFNGGGHAAGHAAGRAANIGQGGVAGKRGELES